MQSPVRPENAPKYFSRHDDLHKDTALNVNLGVRTTSAIYKDSHTDSLAEGVTVLK